MATKKKDLHMQNKVFGWIALATGLILTIPYLAMQFDWVKPDPDNPSGQGVNWGILDFVVAGTLIFGMASLFVLVARQLERKYRLLAAIAFVFLFFWAWAELAVGVFTNIGS